MNVLILGAASDVALACARYFATQKFDLQLAARDLQSLLAVKSDIEIRHQVDVDVYSFDATAFSTHASFYENLKQKPDMVILVFGYLGEQKVAQESWQESHKIIDVNFTGAVSILNIIASDFERRKTGVIAGVSSVAGERGRMSNYIYGSAKAGLTAYLSGLRNRLASSGVHVLTVKPGFMRTKMTEGLPLPGPVTAEPSQVAVKIFNAMLKRKNVIYVLPVWRWIMLIIKSIPEGIFKKLKL